MGERTAKHDEAVLRRDRLELKERRAGDDGVINIEVRIFSGGGDKRDPPVLHVFQKRLLLLAVEILDLVKIQKDAACAEKPLGLVELMEGHARLRGDHRRRRGLSRAGRAVKDHIRQPSRLQHTPKDTARAKQVGLPHDLVHCAGPEGIC